MSSPFPWFTDASKTPAICVCTNYITLVHNFKKFSDFFVYFVELALSHFIFYNKNNIMHILKEQELTMKTSTVLITGASRGIGQAAAKAFAAKGYRLVLNCCHSKEKLEEFASELQQDYNIQVLTCCGDIGDYDFVCQMFHRIKPFSSGIDILVNNAGIDYIGLLSDMTLDEWNHIINTNLTSVFSCCKLAIPYMVARKEGKIINISSAWGSVGASCEAAYSAAKGGINAFTKALAKELAPSNIQVNAIACGVIDTDMNRCFSREEREALKEEIPAGRFGFPEEAAQLILQLAQSPQYLTGQVIGLDGGWI